jgi:pimeloyl-ACP methyl ester carboxylesterase
MGTGGRDPGAAHPRQLLLGDLLGAVRPAGTANPAFVQRLAGKDRSADGDPISPRQVMRTTYVADPASFGADEEAMLDSLLSTVVGEANYPGDATVVASWPGMGPGTRGVLNAMSPKYFRVADDLVGIAAKPPVLWVHGDADAIVGDATLFDLAQLGKLGIVPGWPGEDACPPQPMVAQTRAVLQRYAAAGGSFTEVLLDGCGHSPHIERPAEFLDALLRLIAAAA